MEYRYRTGTNEDIEQLQKLGINSYGQFKNVLSEPDWDKMNIFLRSENVFPELLSMSTCFCCEKDSEITGMAFLIPSGNPTAIFENDWSYIRMVGVHTDHAGKGIGKKLTQMCIDKAKATGEKIVALHTSEFMDAARHMYEKLGFKRYKELDPRYGKRYWIYLLEL